MVEYKCDWCGQGKKPGERWLVGLAAEKNDRLGHAREVTIALGWIEHWARHPLAVHFCSPLHKDYYVARLLGFSSCSRSLQASPAKRKVETTHSQILDRQTPSIRIAGKSATPRRPRIPEPAAPSSGTKLKFSRADHVRAHGMGIELGSATPTRKARPRQP